MKYTRLATLALAPALALGSASLPALASSTAASAASEGISASVGSASESFETSSDSSAKKEKTAVGDYQVLDVAELAERPGTVRLKLQRVATAADTPAVAESLNLYLPTKVLAQQPITAGQVVSAKPRPYGVEFARADTGRAFFLVLHDEWHRELQSNAVVL